MEQAQQKMDDTTSNQGANLDAVSIALPLKSFTKDPDAGFRLSRQIAKKDKNGNFSGISTSVGIIVPNNLKVEEAIKYEAIAEFLLGTLYELQDKAIRVKLDAGETQIRHVDVEFEELNKFAGTLEGVGKLSAEKIEEWFKADASIAVAVLFADQVGKATEEFTEEQKKQLEQRQNAVKSLLVQLASRNTTFASKMVQDKLRTYVDLCSESLMKTRMLARIEQTPILSADAL